MNFHVFNSMDKTLWTINISNDEAPLTLQNIHDILKDYLRILTEDITNEHNAPSVNNNNEPIIAQDGNETIEGA